MGQVDSNKAAHPSTKFARGLLLAHQLRKRRLAKKDQILQSSINWAKISSAIRWEISLVSTVRIASQLELIGSKPSLLCWKGVRLGSQLLCSCSSSLIWRLNILCSSSLFCFCGRTGCDYTQVEVESFIAYGAQSTVLGVRNYQSAHWAAREGGNP